MKIKDAKGKLLLEYDKDTTLNLIAEFATISQDLNKLKSFINKRKLKDFSWMFWGHYGFSYFVLLQAKDFQYNGVINISITDLDLEDKNLSYCNFKNIYFARCNFSFCNISYANLSCKFSQCAMQQVSFIHTRINDTIFANTDLDCSDFSNADFTGLKFDVFIKSKVTNCCFYNTTIKQNYIDPHSSFRGSIFLVLKNVLYFYKQQNLSKQGGICSHQELYTCLSTLLDDCNYKNSKITASGIFYIHKVLIELSTFGKKTNRNDFNIWNECLKKLEYQFPNFIKLPCGFYYDKIVRECKHIIPLIRTTKAGTDCTLLTKLTKSFGPFQNLFLVSDFLTPKIVHALIENFHTNKNLKILNDAKMEIIHEIIFAQLDFTDYEKLMLICEHEAIAPTLSNPQLKKEMEVKEV